MVLWRILHEFIALLKPVLVTFPLSELAESKVFSKWLTFGLPWSSFPLQLRKIRNTSYARSKVSLKLLMPYLRHFKWAICLNIFLSLPHLFLIISSTYSWAMGGLLCSLPVSRACPPPLNTSMCSHNTASCHAGKFWTGFRWTAHFLRAFFYLQRFVCRYWPQRLWNSADYSGSIYRPLTGTVMTSKFLMILWLFSLFWISLRIHPLSACRILLKATVLASLLLATLLSLVCLLSGNLCEWELKLAKSAINISCKIRRSWLDWADWFWLTGW